MENFLDKFPTAEQVEQFNASCQHSIDSYNQSSNARMENYYNCIDDYSYGGVCDKAADQGRQKLQNAMQLIKEQTGPVIEEFESAVLFQDGVQVSDRTINGRFGPCWIIPKGGGAEFVGVAKKQATYIKKGFIVKKRVIKCEYYWTTKMGKNGLIPMARIITDKIEETNSPDDFDSRLSSVAWFALNVYNK